MRSKEDELGEEMPEIPPTLTISTIVDEIEIKHEEVDLLHHNSRADGDSDDHSDPDLDNVSTIAHVDCDSAKAEEKDLKDFYLDIPQFDIDCETCLKYMRKLREHVRTTHVPPQPIRDPLPIDPLHFDLDPLLVNQSSSSIHVKSEVEDGIVRMECSEEESLSNPQSDPDYNVENDIEDDNIEKDSESESDSDYCPSPSFTQKHVRPCPGGVKKHPINESKLLKSKKGTLPSRKPFKCKECDKSFMQKCHLKDHVRSHTGEKPFKCQHCDKGFSFRGGLKAHEKLHTGEKPFKCVECQKSFSRLDTLTIHKRIHTREKPYSCEECDLSFTQSHHLTDHKRTHTGERPFMCDVCGKGFNRFTHLTRHMRLHIVRTEEL